MSYSSLAGRLAVIEMKLSRFGGYRRLGRESSLALRSRISAKLDSLMHGGR